jgi:hypothetical protein
VGGVQVTRQGLEAPFPAEHAKHFTLFKRFFHRETGFSFRRPLNRLTCFKIQERVMYFADFKYKLI